MFLPGLLFYTAIYIVLLLSTSIKPSKDHLIDGGTNKKAEFTSTEMADDTPEGLWNITFLFDSQPITLSFEPELDHSRRKR